MTLFTLVRFVSSVKSLMYRKCFMRTKGLTKFSTLVGFLPYMISSLCNKERFTISQFAVIVRIIGCYSWVHSGRSLSLHIPRPLSLLQKCHQEWLRDSKTQEHKVAEILQHHIPVQIPLSRLQAFPLFWREINGYIPEGQHFLKSVWITRPCSDLHVRSNCNPVSLLSEVQGDCTLLVRDNWNR